MGDWRDRLSMNPSEIAEMSAESMASNRIMKSMGASTKNIGSICKHLNIPYKEEETTFQRAVNIFREVYADASLVLLFDVKTGKKIEDVIDDLLDDPRPSIIFFRIDRDNEHEARMTAFVRDQNLQTSPLGGIVIRPGIRYIACQGAVQLWEQEPVKLLKSFKKEEV